MCISGRLKEDERIRLKPTDNDFFCHLAEYADNIQNAHNPDYLKKELVKCAVSEREKMNNFISGVISPKKKENESKDILKANKKDRHIINVYDELFAKHNDHGAVLTIMGRRTDLNVGTENSKDKNRTDTIRVTLTKYGRVKQKQRQS